MAAISVELLCEALNGVHTTCAGLAGSAVVSADGIVLASKLAAEVDPLRFGAMCATVLALAARMANEVSRGPLRQVILEGELGPVLLTQAGDVGVLALVATHEAPLGRLVVTARNAAASIRGDLPERAAA